MRKRTGVVAGDEAEEGGDDDGGAGERPWRPCHSNHRRDGRDETAADDYNAVMGDLVRVEQERVHHRRRMDGQCALMPKWAKGPVSL